MSEMADPETDVMMEETSETESEIEMGEEDSQTEAEMSEEEKEKLGEAKKLEGNEQYKAKNYQEAVDLYTQAIASCPQCAAYYGNRAAAYIMLQKYDDALLDARRSTQLDSQFLKGHLREAKCHLMMGEPLPAVREYEHVLLHDSGNATAKQELPQAEMLAQYMKTSDDAYEKNDYRKVVYLMDRCRDIAPTCKQFQVIKAECLALLKRYQEATDITSDLIRMDGMNADALYVRGLCLYYQDNVDKAFQHFTQVLRLAPDHHKAKSVYRKAKQLKLKKEEGNKEFRCGRFENALKLYTEALGVDPLNKFTNSKLYCNRAAVLSRMGKHGEAINDCNEAIKLDDTYLKAYMRRAKCYLDTEQYEEAVRDYEKIFRIDKTRDNQRLLQEAKLELKKSKRKDYYKVLGVGKNANEDDIKKAYRKRALLHHPDRHSSSTEEKIKDEEKKFKEVGEAYTVLSDAKKKARYDSGQDLEDMDNGFSGGDIDPNIIFQSFFGGGAPGGFSFGGMGGGGGGGGGMPGGFSFQFG